jgi:threonine/homoserine/homoserine lactone efflux protein
MSLSYTFNTVNCTGIHQMETAWLLSMLGFLWVAAITPGPNNILLTSTAANFGFGRSVPVLFGIMLGMQSLLIFVSLGVGSLLLLFPAVHTALKILGSAYLLWIAWKIATSNYEQLNTDARVKPVAFFHAGLLQFLNPKAWLMGLGAVSSFSLANAYLSSVVAISVALAVVNLAAGMIWIGFGSVIGRLLRSRRSWFIFNLTMGAMTAGCVILVWL